MMRKIKKYFTARTIEWVMVLMSLLFACYFLQNSAEENRPCREKPVEAEPCKCR